MEATEISTGRTVPASADQAWQLLNNGNEKTGIGWVIAAALLADKRPKLIPVYDSIVSCQFRAPKHVWLKLHDQLRSQARR
ncbi:DUF6308 family protein [Micromonospora sp. NPDC049374]|uniref:DUF6308 family protein n=1 Tax=Micromonospora sp. NPDC049374 TaxID=3154352 RepID=UPI00342305F0